MDELSRHIEVLLLENDCVIVPGLGGFITHYQPAMKAETEDVFLPPCRTIGFNPLLRLNDGLLIQSYMSVYSISYFEANKMIEHEVRELMSTLFEDGHVQLRGVGELQYDISGRYRFIPDNDKIVTPELYGTDSFDMPDLAEIAALKAEEERKKVAAQQAKPQQEKPQTIVMQPQVTGSDDDKRAVSISLRRIGQYAGGVAAAVLLIVASFFFATPLEQTPEIDGNYANMLPKEIFDKFNCNSLLFNPVVEVPSDKTTATANAVEQTSEEENMPAETVADEKEAINTEAADTNETTTADVKVEVQEASTKPQATTVTKKLYNVIVASVGSEEGADNMVQSLKSQGYDGAKVIVGDGKIRVSVQSFEAETDAYRSIRDFQQQGLFDQAWVLRR